MAATPQQVTTLDQFFALPEDNTRRHELLDGGYFVSPPPKYRHQQAVMDLFVLLKPALDDRPDLVLSPGTAARDRGIKRQLYQKAGIPEYWIVDLDSRMVERWRPEDERPEILRETLSWQPYGSAKAVAIDLPGFFGGVAD